MPEFSRKQESPEHEPTPEPLESRLALREQYERAIRALNQTGVLELLPEKSALGVVGIDGKEYPMPEYEKLLEALKENEQLLKEKTEQGFNKLLLVPIAIPLEVLILRYKQALKKHYQEKKLFGLNKETGLREPIELDLNQPVYVWDEYKQADEQGKLVYNPRSFTKDNQGQTKQELKEQGLTPEDWLAYALTVLEERNEVIDDWQSRGSISYLTGAYFSVSGYVPSAVWSRDDRQANLDRLDPGYRDESCGARAAVRVGKG